MLVHLSCVPAAKFFGGLSYLVMVGFFFDCPGWTNDEEVCVSCGNDRGTRGCVVGAIHNFPKDKKALKPMKPEIEHRNVARPPKQPATPQ